MQIVRSGKVLWLYDLVIRGKTFVIVQQFETPFNRKKKFAGKPLRLEANPQKPRKFSTANNLHYTVSGRLCVCVRVCACVRVCVCPEAINN